MPRTDATANAYPETAEASRHASEHYRRIDRLMWMPALLLLVLCLTLGFTNGTWPLALGVAVVILPPIALLQWRLPGHPANGFAKAFLYMALAALLIEQSGGLIEAHFSIFIMLSALILYSDWRVIAVGAGVIALHHALFTWLQALGLASLYAGLGEHEEHAGAALLVCLLQHGGAVVAQALILGYLSLVLRGQLQDGLRVAAFAARAGQGRLDDVFTRRDLGRPTLAAIETMQQRVASTLHQVRATASEVGDLGDALASSQAELGEQAERNAGQVARVSASATQLSATTRESASEAARVRELAEAAARHARHGQQEVEALGSAMTRLEGDAAGIASLLGDIDQITFQTNLLALNASVEAARAGDQGRGFAVVAGEVRQLSQHTSEIAESIRRRIHETGESVQAGAQRTRTASDAMAEVLGAFDQVAARLVEIDGASREQHLGIEELEGSVLEMQAALQASRQALHASQANAERLAQTASSLLAAVGTFRLARPTSAARLAQTG
ncbi:methyl-accepting chemotaxis protein [Halomonas sp. JS92-SW72]|uniref:methyl-accepting chemotaxis protein n=1 Tax=Halomonas sp. JS92-SW72 TaxID=2306583 RepID=UPI0013C35AA5|nr:methyl-accepting chemotaxis protein [Halomonas sp. JS92-SW72]